MTLYREKNRESNPTEKPTDRSFTLEAVALFLPHDLAPDPSAFWEELPQKLPRLCWVPLRERQALIRSSPSRDPCHAALLIQV